MNTQLELEFVNSIKSNTSRLNELLELPFKERSIDQNREISEIRSHIEDLKLTYIDMLKPCEIGDKFTCMTNGGRRVSGVCKSFMIFKNKVMIESYNPILKGLKTSSIAFFSLPHSEIEIIL